MVALILHHSNMLTVEEYQSRFEELLAKEFPNSKIEVYLDNDMFATKEKYHFIKIDKYTFEFSPNLLKDLEQLGVDIPVEMVKHITWKKPFRERNYQR